MNSKTKDRILRGYLSPGSFNLGSYLGLGMIPFFFISGFNCDSSMVSTDITVTGKIVSTEKSTINYIVCRRNLLKMCH